MQNPTTTHLRLDRHYFLCSAAAAGVAATLAPRSEAALIYSGVQNLPILPMTINGGVYIDVETPFASSQEPVVITGWDINPYNGGQSIYGAPGTRLVMDGSKAANLAVDTVISAGSNFSTPGYFALVDIPDLSTGYVGFSFDPQNVPGVQTWYGWMQISVNSAGNGSVINWAYDDTGAPVKIPEPASLAMLALGTAGLTMMRRRRAERA